MVIFSIYLGRITEVPNIQFCSWLNNTFEIFFPKYDIRVLCLLLKNSKSFMLNADYFMLALFMIKVLPSRLFYYEILKS